MAVRFLVPILVACLAMTGPAHAAEIVPSEHAAAAIGSTVTVEGDVAAVRVEGDGLVLELAPGGPTGFRAVLVIALISSLPRQPERLYEGRRVRVTGLVQRFHGRPEMVLESASLIEIVDLAGAPAPVAATTTVPPTSVPPTTTGPAGPPSPPVANRMPPGPPAVAPAPVPAPAAPAPSPPAAAAPAPPLLADRLRADACRRARARWDETAARVRTASTALTRCLDGGSHRCRLEATALAPVLSDLEWAEQDVAEGCD